MNERTCIVTRKSGERDRLIRFVADPEGFVVPDLKRNLPGRGCWVTATRSHVERAVRRQLFSRALKHKVSAGPDLPDQVDRLLARSALGALGLARKAGNLALGATRVDAAVRSGAAIAVLHAVDAAQDGVRKLDQARSATEKAGGPRIPADKLFSEEEMSLALGGANVIHAAVLAGSAGEAALKRLVALREYRTEMTAEDGIVPVGEKAS